MVKAMLYRMQVGCPLRDLPVEFEKLEFNIQKFNRWSYKNKLGKIFKCFVHDSKFNRKV